MQTSGGRNARDCDILLWRSTGSTDRADQYTVATKQWKTAAHQQQAARMDVIECQQPFF